MIAWARFRRYRGPSRMATLGWLCTIHKCFVYYVKYSVRKLPEKHKSIEIVIFFSPYTKNKFHNVIIIRWAIFMEKECIKLYKMRPFLEKNQRTLAFAASMKSSTTPNTTIPLLILNVRLRVSNWRYKKVFRNIFIQSLCAIKRHL